MKSFGDGCLSKPLLPYNRAELPQFPLQSAVVRCCFAIHQRCLASISQAQAKLPAKSCCRLSKSNRPSFLNKLLQTSDVCKGMRELKLAAARSKAVKSLSSDGECRFDLVCANPRKMSSNILPRGKEPPRKNPIVVHPSSAATPGVAILKKCRGLLCPGAMLPCSSLPFSFAGRDGSFKLPSNLVHQSLTAVVIPRSLVAVPKVHAFSRTCGNHSRCANQCQHNRRVFRRVVASRLRIERHGDRQHQGKSKYQQRLLQIHDCPRIRASLLSFVPLVKSEMDRLLLVAAAPGPAQPVVLAASR